MITEVLLSRLDGVRHAGEGCWSARCPAHNDRHNSLSVGLGADGRILLKCHAGCAIEDVVDALGLTLGDLFPDKRGGGVVFPLQQHSNGATVAEYAAAKQLSVEVLKSLKIVDLHLQGTPAIKIPYFDREGNETAVRFRKAIVKTEGADERFSWRKGSKTSLYGLWRLKPSDYIVVCEGESDCHTLWSHGIPALGLPGAGNWNEQRDAAHLDGIPKIYVVVEPDRGGETVKAAFAKSALLDRIHLLSLAPCKDPSELHCADPAAFKEKFGAAMASAVPLVDIVREEEKRRLEEAWKTCSVLATHPSILTAFAEAYQAAGAVGEVRVAKLLYLALTSRFLRRLVSIAVKGPSSGGKSFTVETVLRFFPDEAVYCVTAMSERALAYTDADLSHRFLVIYEAIGMSGEFGDYLIRSLLSEGRLVYEVVEKTSEGMKPRRIEKEGPTGLIVTTTSVRLHPENETRLLSLQITDTPEQTRAVMGAIASGTQPEFDPAPWIALQEWLAGAAHEVVVPYAAKLADCIPPVAVRLRRDFGQLLNLIRAHALLHQATRERDPDGRVIAAFDDYAAVRELVGDLIAEGIEATVPSTVRETVAAVQRLLDGGSECVSIHQVAHEMRLDKGAASRRVATAIHRGYLKNLEDRKGRPARLQIADSLPDELVILPPVEVLTGCSVEGRDKWPPPPRRDYEEAVI